MTFNNVIKHFVGKNVLVTCIIKCKNVFDGIFYFFQFVDNTYILIENKLEKVNIAAKTLSHP